jgi:hypothetical protein
MLGSVLAKAPDLGAVVVKLDIMHDINVLAGAILSVLEFKPLQSAHTHAMHLAALKALGAMLSLPSVLLDEALSIGLKTKVFSQVEQLANIGTGT